jgi:hypothetical protein
MDALKDLIQNTNFDNTIGQYLAFFGCILAGIDMAFPTETHYVVNQK